MSLLICFNVWLACQSYLKHFFQVWKASLHLMANRKTAIPFGTSGTKATRQGSDGTSQPLDSIYFMYSSWFSCSMEDLEYVFISLHCLDVCLSAISKFNIYISSLRLSDWHLWVVHLICSKLQFWISLSFPFLTLLFLSYRRMLTLFQVIFKSVGFKRSLCSSQSLSQWV